MIVAIIQARTESTRLPGKVLRRLRGRPLIAHVVERVRHTKSIERLVVATTSRPADDPLAEWCASADVVCYRGPAEDVLERYVQAAYASSARTIVRVTGDCPLIDPNVIDQVVEQFLQGDYDYVSNVDPPTFPDGLDTEVTSRSVLECAAREATHSSDREHVTTYIRQRPDRFRIGCVRHEPNLASYRWTVDEPQDWQFVEAVCEELPAGAYDLASVLHVLQQFPELKDINASIQRNEGYRKSRLGDLRAARMDCSSTTQTPRRNP